LIDISFLTTQLKIKITENNYIYFGAKSDESKDAQFYVVQIGDKYLLRNQVNKLNLCDKYYKHLATYYYAVFTCDPDKRGEKMAMAKSNVGGDGTLGQARFV
jgi:hypothetical protein